MGHRATRLRFTARRTDAAAGRFGIPRSISRVSLAASSWLSSRRSPCRPERVTVRAKGAHANEPKASFVEPNPFGFICRGLATIKRTVMPDAQRLIYPSIAAAKDHQNQ
jgi:hypothetical protein